MGKFPLSLRARKFPLILRIWKSASAVSPTFFLLFQRIPAFLPWNLRHLHPPPPPFQLSFPVSLKNPLFSLRTFSSSSPSSSVPLSKSSGKRREETAEKEKGRREGEGGELNLNAISLLPNLFPYTRAKVTATKNTNFKYLASFSSVRRRLLTMYIQALQPPPFPLPPPLL